MGIRTRKSREIFLGEEKQLYNDPDWQSNTSTMFKLAVAALALSTDQGVSNGNCRDTM